MIIDVAQDLSKLSLFADRREQELILGYRESVADEVEVVSFERPVLLTDNARVAGLEPGLRDAVFSLYQSYPRVVRYDAVAVSWSPSAYPRVWCPSIDTVFFARTLKRELEELEPKTMLELGTGSGFLSKFALKHGPEHLEVSATDILQDALNCAWDSVRLDQDPDAESFGWRHRFHGQLVEAGRGLGVRFSSDLVITNPPYIPRPKARVSNAFEGLDLLARLAQRPGLVKKGGRALVNISTVSGNAPVRWLREAGFRVEELDRLRVPLKVNNVVSGLSPDSRDWLSYLERKRLVEVADEGGYRYWHTLRMLRLTRKPTTKATKTPPKTSRQRRR